MDRGIMWYMSTIDRQGYQMWLFLANWLFFKINWQRFFFAFLWLFSINFGYFWHISSGYPGWQDANMVLVKTTYPWPVSVIQDGLDHCANVLSAKMDATWNMDFAPSLESVCVLQAGVEKIVIFVKFIQDVLPLDLAFRQSDQIWIFFWPNGYFLKGFGLIW